MKAQLKELEALPEAIHAQVAAAGTKIFIGPGHTGDMKGFAPEVKSVVAQMNKTSRKASETGGVYIQAQGEKNGMVLIGTHQFQGHGAYRMKIDVQEIGVARHEFGHAFDFTAATPISKDQQFKDAWRNMFMHEKSLPEGKRKVHPYFLQTIERESNNPNWTKGTTETFAESFRAYWQAGGGDKGRDAVEAYFSKGIADRFHELMKGLT